MHPISEPEGERLFVYCLRAWLTAMLPSVTLLGAGLLLLSVMGVDLELLDRAPDLSLTWRDATGALVIAPVVETFLLAALLAMLGLLRGSRKQAATASALIWGALHGLQAAMWFFGTVWSFYVFSLAYLSWRPHGFRKAFTAAAVPHALNNLCVLLLATSSSWL